VVVVRDAENTELGHGEGPNKRAAQMQAAKMALLHLNGSQTRLNENSP
jgi:dsRNA-specific ribonuclease